MTADLRLLSKIAENATTIPLYRASLSTMWAIGNFDRLEDFFDATLQLGYAGIELNHQVTDAMLDGIDLSRYPISSVHEPCPLFISAEQQKSRGWLISAPEEEKRRHGVESIMRSIDLAHQLGAPLVIVHSGQVDIPQTRENQLRALYESGRKGTPDYETLKQRMTAERAKASGPHLEAVKKSLVELVAHAAPLGVRLGLENRDRWNHIPNPEEMEELLSLGGPESLGFWFDCGHAAKLDRLGFFGFESWLQRFSSRMVGCHLHDMIGLEDHHAPGMGDMDFDLIARYLPDGILRTLELHPRLTAQQVTDGVRTLAEKGLVEGF